MPRYTGFVSRSLFLVKAFLYDGHGNIVSTNQLVGCGFSPIAIIFAISLGSLMVCTILGLGMRRFSSNMPLAVSCSAAISAACHPPPGDERHAFKPIMWGEIPMTKEVNHARRNSEADGEEEGTTRSESGSATQSSQPDEVDLSSDRRQWEESSTHLLTESGGPEPDEENSAVHGHCSFLSDDVITPSPLRLYL